jgi:hypothetical protein
MGVEKNEEVTPRKINSLKKLANSNFTRFAIQVQHMNAEVQKMIIEQLPEFKQLATDAVKKISKAQESTLDSIQHSEDQGHQGISEWRSALITMLEDEELSLDEKLRITSQIGETVRAHAALIAEGNKAKAALFGQMVLGVVGVIGFILVTVAGGKFGIDQGDNNA